MWSYIHRFVLWLPLGVGGIYFAALAVATDGANYGNPQAKELADSQFAMVGAIMNAPYLILLTAGIFAIWLAGFFWSAHKAAEEARHSTVSLGYRIKRDSFMPSQDEEIIRRILERLPPSVKNVVKTSHQSGGIAANDVHIHSEDKSLKGQIRRLMAAVDSRIPDAIDAEALEIETRMTPAQFKKLSQLAETPGSAQFIAKADVTGRLMHSTINNGSFGPTTAEGEQIRVKIRFTSEIRV